MAPAARPSRAVTQADVAALAGVSTAVVSYVLNGGPRPVSADAMARVLAAAEKLEYRPNAAARALSKGSSGLIGLIVPTIENPFFGAFARVVEIAARRRGRDVVICSTLDDPAAAVSLLRHLDGLQVEGIVLGTSVPRGQESACYRVSARLIVFNAAVALPGIPAVVGDLAGGARAAVRHLVELGHERVAFLGDPDADEPRHRGWREAHGGAGRYAAAEYSREGGYEAMRGMLAAGPAPTALFAASDLIAVGALRALREAGLRVPEDVSLVTFDDSPEALFAGPSLTAVRQPIDAMASAVVDAVLGGDLAAELHTFDVELIERASTAPPAAVARPR